MKRNATIACLLVGGFVGGFCIFGFMATFEPSSDAIAFRIRYAVVGVACLAGMAFAVLPRKDN